MTDTKTKNSLSVETRSTVLTLVQFFAQEGESKLDVGREVRKLSEAEQAKIAVGIRNGTFNY